MRPQVHMQSDVDASYQPGITCRYCGSPDSGDHHRQSPVESQPPYTTIDRLSASPVADGCASLAHFAMEAH